uniref:Uncharacterized protein n=1 Tax=Timema genevievae TaxID=629358 RepID=A0A7R9PM05_TIMGE|nr:unnamed protein product [Timema genevievae]
MNHLPHFTVPAPHDNNSATQQNTHLSKTASRNELTEPTQVQVMIARGREIVEHSREFEKAVQRRSDSKAVLGDQSIQEYLCKRLNCSEAAFRYMTKKQPAILKVHVTKLQETLDFLFEEGFSSNQVQQMPRVLCHSLATIQVRLTELRDLGYNPISFSILCKSLHEYSEFINKMSGSRKQIAL